MLGEKYSIVLLLVLLLALVFLIEKSTEANITIRCNERERRALLDFKQSLAAVDESDFIPSSNINISSWGSGDEKEDCCNWIGVNCNDSTGHVVELDLYGLIGRVTGTFSPSLLELRYLSTLNLGENDFNGSSIPEFIGYLSELTSLYLGDCNFGGKVPYQLGNLSRLVQLDLSGNDFNGSSIPEFIGSLTELTTLFFIESQFSGPIPSKLGNLSRLVELYLSYNQLTGSIPDSFGNICSLQLLHLESNNLGGDVLGFLRNTSLCTKYSLEELLLAGNQLIGSVPDEIAKLPSLQVLSLEYNRLNGSISRSIGQLSNLTTLLLNGNSFDGVVISEAHFSKSSKLTRLGLSDTSLALKFSSDWVPPFQLQIINLRSCKLGPSFPHWIGSQDTAYEIDVSASGISDSIPSSFWNKSRALTSLNLSFNQISGYLPTNFNFNPDLAECYLHDACLLDLSSNNLTGPLPKLPNYFGVWTSINLSNNKLFGSITSICENSTQTVFLDLSNNLFSGEVSNCFAEWEYLQVLNLAENKLSGLVPMSIGSATRLQMLSLRSNSLSGPLPSSLQNCSKLRFLDLSDNKLSGNIPEWIGQSFSRLIFLSLQNNHFNGSIPHQLCELSDLHILDLSLNRLSSTIPQCLSNLTSMAQINVKLNRTVEQSIFTERYPSDSDHVYIYVDGALLRWKGQKQRYAKILGLVLVIDLSSNRLTGEIPDELTSLRELVALNLSRNILTGKIPRKIGQLTQLDTLDLSRNKLSGSIPQSLSELTFLGSLDLSYNNLSGEIPKGTQLQGFDPSFFSHNHGLCGPPISPNCSGPVEMEPPQGEPDQDDVDEFMKWFYAGMGLGFAVGFWGFCGAVFFKRSWRHSYFRFLDNLKDWLYLAIVLHKARLDRRIRA